METISYEYEGALYVNLTNRCDCACVFCLRHNGHKGSIYADDLGWSTSLPGRRPSPTSLPTTRSTTGSWCSAASGSPPTASPTCCGWWTGSGSR